MATTWSKSRPVKAGEPLERGDRVWREGYHDVPENLIGQAYDPSPWGHPMYVERTIAEGRKP